GLRYERHCAPYLVAQAFRPASRNGEHDICGHPDGEAPVRVVHAQSDFERLDIALLAADVALRRERRIGASIEHGALALDARGQPYRQLVADPDAVDIALFHVDPHPQVVRVDHGHDRLTG